MSVQDEVQQDDVQDQDGEARAGAPIRTYVILEQVEIEGDSGTGEAPYPAFVEATRVEARNGNNALRKAYKELRGNTEGDAVFIPIPESQWQPVTVRGERRSNVTVSIGG